VNSIRYRSFLLCLLLLVTASSAIAQNYAFPAYTPNTDVLCSTCPGRETLLTIGYPPVLRFVGRWVDAESEKDYQQNFRTARPKLARYVPARNRIYTLLGSALAVYDSDRFFARLNNFSARRRSSFGGIPSSMPKTVVVGSLHSKMDWSGCSISTGMTAATSIWPTPSLAGASSRTTPTWAVAGCRASPRL